ncbi:MAG: hypothetical protein PGN13_02685 [Patulibacter minatonensis]
MAGKESRFGFGQFAGAAGAVVVASAVSQPWLKLDFATAFQAALSPGDPGTREHANAILYTVSNVPKDQLDQSPQATQLIRAIGIEPTGYEQDKIAAIVLGVLALIALIAVVRSVLAATAWAARGNAPFLAIAGLGTLAAAALELWVFAPHPRDAMRPDTGMWMLVGGAVLLLLGALTLGNNRRRPFLDDDDAGPGARNFSADGEHLAYSHGAWVPRSAAETER